jgi:hypothetical protein
VERIVDHVELRQHDHRQRPEADGDNEEDRHRRAVALKEAGLGRRAGAPPLEGRRDCESERDRERSEEDQISGEGAAHRPACARTIASWG